ncbi:MAG: SPOR domain-containing protein [Planctomycetota bacterium]
MRLRNVLLLSLLSAAPALAGPDQPGQKTGPAPLDKKTEPAPADEKTGPAPVEKKAEPAPADKKTEPGPADEKKAPPAPKTYDVRKLVGPVGKFEADELVELLTIFTDEDEWDEPAEMVYRDGDLVVTQRPAVHRALGELIGEIERCLSGKGKSPVEWRRALEEEEKAAEKKRTPAEKKASERLTAKVTVAFQQARCEEALDFARKTTGLTIELTEEAKELVAEDPPLVSLEGETTVTKLLDAIVACPELEGLVWVREGTKIRIGSARELHTQRCRVFDTGPLLARGLTGEQLVERLDKACEEHDGCVEFAGGVLFVYATPPAHQAILKALVKLEQGE